MEFIPNVYFIKATNIEGSLIPWVIAQIDTTYKNFIISTDKYDTQYQIYPDKFCTHYIRKSLMGSSIFCSFEKYILDLFKENMDESTDTGIFKNSSFYTTLLSALGDKPRSLEPIKGVGTKTVAKLLHSGIENGAITKDTSSIELILKSLPDEFQEYTKSNFHCIDLQSQYNELSQQDVFNITNQIIDRFDYNSLIELNSSDYKEYPLMLPELTM
jgi:hypothetical protein